MIYERQMSDDIYCRCKYDGRSTCRVKRGVNIILLFTSLRLPNLDIFF